MAMKRKVWYLVLMIMALLITFGSNCLAAAPVHEAAANGKLDKLKSIIDSGVDINVKDPDNNDWSLLHAAAAGGHLKAAEYLLVKGIAIDGKDKHEATALHVAANKGQFEMLKYLIDKGADINVIQELNGATSLHEAAFSGNIESVKYLVQKGAHSHIDQKDSLMQTPMSVALEEKHLEIVRYLADEFFQRNGILPDIEDKDGRTPLHIAAENGNLSELKNWLDAGMDVNTRAEKNYEECALHSAADRGFLDIVKYLVKEGADIEARDIWNKTPLALAVEQGRFDIVKYLVKEGADINIEDKNGMTPLDLAKKNKAKKANHKKVIKYLRSKGANETTDVDTP